MIDKKGLIYSTQLDMFSKPDVIGFGNNAFHVEEILRDKANEIIVKNHYSHKYNLTSKIHLGVHIDGVLIGALQFGKAMNPASQEGVVKNTLIDEYLELNRMWLDDIAPRNSESKAISYCIKYIKNRHKKIKWIQSFADERCGKLGIVYQAANFKYYGLHKSIFWTLDGIVYHNSAMTRDPSTRPSADLLQAGKDRATSEELRQFRYIYFIDKRSIKDAVLKELPYVKYYNEV